MQRYTLNANQFHGAETEVLYRGDVLENITQVAAKTFMLRRYRDVWIRDNETDRVVWHNGNLTSPMNPR